MKTETGKKHKPNKTAVAAAVLSAALLLTAVGSIATGARFLTFEELIDGLFRPEKDPLIASIVRSRIPRTLFGLCCGAALGVSGALTQAVTRNPIADPSILGVNTGASLAVVCAMSFLNAESLRQYILPAILGAALTSALVYGIGSLGKGGASPVKLVLAGAAVSAALTSLIGAILMPRGFVIDKFRFWQVGSVGAGTWDTLAVLAPFLAAGLLIGAAAAPALNALALGDETAKGLGVRTGRLRLAATFGGVILCGAATATAGPIGFLGLLAPHAVRLLAGPDFRRVVPLSAPAGAVILTLADMLGRMLGSPGELEAGVVTAFLGAPLLIFLAMKSKVKRFE
ncbi:MAG: iron ABC transporter permease [Clostridiales bacterium]|jgi:iron complex transport system permease protein|nr:iron ABC transporter permease [Clostridiales bacterium]